MDRRAILSLIALGRVTPPEAERLLAVTAEEDELILRLAVCLAVVWLALPQIHQLWAGLNHMLGVVLPAISACGHCGLRFFAQQLGGMS